MNAPSPLGSEALKALQTAVDAVWNSLGQKERARSTRLLVELKIFELAIAGEREPVRSASADITCENGNVVRSSYGSPIFAPSTIASNNSSPLKIILGASEATARADL
jgi:hypothetical protein